MSDETEIPGGDEGGGGTGDAISAFIAEEPERPARGARHDPEADDAEPEPALPRERAPKKPAGKPEPAARSKPRTEPAKEPEEPAEGEEGEEGKDKPPEKRTYKHKVLGEERELDADEIDRVAASIGVDPRELLGAASLKRAAYERMQEAARLRRPAEELIALARTDPLRALQVAGLPEEKLNEIIQRRVLELYSAEYDPGTGQPLSAEQRQALQWKKRAEAAEATQRQAAEHARRVEEHQEAETTRARWVKTIVGELEKRGESRAILPRVAQHLSAALEHDPSADPAAVMDDAVAQSMDDLQAEHGILFDSMEWPAIKAKFPGLVDKIRKGIVADYKARGRREEPSPAAEPRNGAPRRSSQRVVRTTGDVMAEFIKGR
ncbi:MAG: hypothetical protein JXA90_09030 [Planctomycetes bacterium]|nr:hypothetical protein [Planctomycetota bacterium]